MKGGFNFYSPPKKENQTTAYHPPIIASVGFLVCALRLNVQPDDTYVTPR